MSVTATATVTLTIEVKADGCWGDGSDIAQVHRQARESAVQILNRCVNPTDRNKIKIIGTPKIVNVITTNE
jgi:hypothetical protein